MIKVCMIVNKQYRYDPRVRRYADTLVDAGAQVDILCLSGQGQSSGKQRNGVRVFPIPIGRLGESIGNYLLQYGIALFLFSIWLIPLYIKNRYQIIHVHNMPDFLVLAALIPRIFGTQIILDIHDPMPDFYATKFNNTRRDTRAVALMRFQEKVSSMIAQAVITVNMQVKDNLIQRGIPADKVTVIRNLPNPTIFDRKVFRKEPGKKDGFFTLIFPGTIAPRYGLDTAIRALPLLVPRIPELRLIIIGPHSEHVQDLAKLADNLGVGPYVHFEPVILQEEIPHHLVRANVGIYPAIQDLYMNMATPTKVLEYAAMGLPIIAARVQVLEQLFPDSSIMFFKPGDEHDFARCVIELYNNPELQTKLVLTMDNIFERMFSWADEQLIYLRLLNRLLGPRQGFQFTDMKIGELESGDK